LIDLSPLYRRIADGEYEVCAFAVVATAAIELKMGEIVARGPYRHTYSDGGIAEFQRVETPPGED